MPTMLAISGQLYWMTVTNHWMETVSGSVLHVTGVGTDTDTDRHEHRHIHRHAHTHTRT